MPIPSLASKHVSKRKEAEIYVVIGSITLLVVYKFLLYFAQAIQNYFIQYTTLPVANLITNILFIMGVFLLCITYRGWKRALASEHELTRILASIRQEVIMTVGPERTIMMCNDAIHALYGYTPQEVIGKTTELLYHDRRSSDPSDSVFRSLTDVGFHVGEATGRRKNGEEFLLEIMTADLKGAPGAVVLLRDVSELRQMERKTHESEMRYRRMFELSPEAIITLSPSGIITDMNERMNDWLGYDPQEVMGRPLDKLRFISEDDRPTVIEMFRHRMLGEKLPPYDVTFVSKNGEELVGNVTATSILDEHGAPIEVLVLIADVTLKRHAEEAIRLAHDLAIESADLKSQFLANMSHELRTPMNGIITVAQLALGTQMPAELRDYLETISDSSRTLLRIINDILDFSKVDAGKLELYSKPFALPDAVVDAIRPLAIQAADKGIEVIASLDSDLPVTLVGDVGRLSQILVNLVSNGVKFTAHGEVVTSVKLDSETNEHVKLRFEVSDSGIGIPANSVSAIFEAFGQGDASISRKYGGTGLGLAISSRLVEMLKGEMGVESTKGEGSTFWFTAEFDKPPAAAPFLPPKTQLSCNVLIAAPSSANRLSLSKQLTAWDCPHTCVIDSNATWHALQDAVTNGNPFDVLLIDTSILSSCMGEVPLRTRINASKSVQAVRIVEIVAFAESDQTLAQSETVARVAKPVRASDLYNSFLSVLGRESTRAHTVPPQTFAPKAIPSPSGRQWRILLAEDNLVNQKVALAILGKAGLTAEIVPNGLEAIESLSERDYDIVLMDVQMPVMDGFKATQIIRNEKSSVRNHNIPTVAMTAHAMKGDRQRCLDAGMTDYISKPIDPAILIEVVTRLLHAEAAQPLKKDAPPPPPIANVEPVFDRKGALYRMGNDAEFLAEVITIFHEDVDEQINSLAASIAVDNADGIQLHAHSIKGSAANIGAVQVQKLAGVMEQEAKQGNLTDMGLKLTTLRSAIDIFRAEV